MENVEVQEPKVSERLAFLINQLRMAYLENDIVRLAFVPNGTGQELSDEISSLSESVSGPDTENLRNALNSIEIVETDESLTDMTGQPAEIQVVKLSQMPEFVFRQKMYVDAWAQNVELMRLYNEEGLGLVPTTSELRLLALLYPLMKQAIREVQGTNTQVMPTPPKLSNIIRK